jgi:hypothetical protein
MVKGKKGRKPTGPLSPEELLVLVFVWRNPDSSLGEVKTGTDTDSTLKLLRSLKSRRYVSRTSRAKWRALPFVRELLSAGAMMRSGGLDAFRVTPERQQPAVEPKGKGGPHA